MPPSNVFAVKLVKRRTAGRLLHLPAPFAAQTVGSISRVRCCRRGLNGPRVWKPPAPAGDRGAADYPATSPPGSARGGFILSGRLAGSAQFNI